MRSVRRLRRSERGRSGSPVLGRESPKEPPRECGRTQGRSGSLLVFVSRRLSSSLGESRPGSRGGRAVLPIYSSLLYSRVLLIGYAGKIRKRGGPRSKNTL